MPPLNGGLQSLARTGQAARLVAQYFPAYARAFSKILYFSYFDEHLADYTDEPELLSKVRLLPGRSDRLYTVRLPFRWATDLRRCDVLRVFQITGAVPAAIARLRWRIPYAATYGFRYAEVARVEARPRRALLLWLLEQFGLRTANAVIVTTPALQQHVKCFVSAERVHLIPNSVDTERFAPAPHLPRSRTIVFVGRLEPQKNLSVLIEAFARLPPTVQLIVAGDGAQRDQLMAQAAVRRVTVDWRGVVSHAALPTLLRTADVFVLPSLVEGHPKALLEAMSCGLPCVGLDVPGTRDVIRPRETGLLAAPTAAGLADALRCLLEDHALAARLGQAARAWVVKHLSAQTVMQREVELLHQLAQTRRA